jgi:hypothetical protein
MAGKNKDLPNHLWKVMGTKYEDGYSYFVYSCKKCPAQTLNGIPLVPPFDQECDKSLKAWP